MDDRLEFDVRLLDAGNITVSDVSGMNINLMIGIVPSGYTIAKP
jgi:hypothetical protein